MVSMLARVGVSRASVSVLIVVGGVSFDGPTGHKIERGGWVVRGRRACLRWWW